MNVKHSVAVAIVVGSCFQPVFAISEAYRAQLENSGCTQASEASGTCDSNQAYRQHTSQGLQRESRNALTKRDAAKKIAHDLDTRLAGMYQGQAVDLMQEEGWHSANAERTRWQKSGITLAFDMTASGRLAGVTVQ